MAEIAYSCVGLLLKRILLTAVFILALVSAAIASTQLVSLVGANQLVLTSSSGMPIRIFSPRNETYNSSSILLSFSGEAYCSFDISVGDIYYSLDGGETRKVTNIAIGSQVPIPAINIFTYRITYTGSVSFSNLSDGSHSITVYRKSENSSVNFTVDTTPPNISVLSPQNKTYEVANATLNFTLSEAASQVSYVLDGEEKLVGEDNTTLVGLSNGEHNVTVCATDLVGNTGASETIYFTVKVPEPFPTVPVLAASIIAIVAAGAGFLVYFKKRKSEAELS